MATTQAMAADAESYTIATAGTRETLPGGPAAGPQLPCLPHISRSRRPFSSLVFNVFLSGLVLVNFSVIGISVTALIKSRQAQRNDADCSGGEGGQEVVVPPLCVSCLGKGNEEGWRRVKGEDGDVLCCPLDHQRLFAALQQVYHTTAITQQQEFFNTSVESEDRTLVWNQEVVGDLQQTLHFANHHKPAGHVTGVQPLDANTYYVPGSDVQLVADWPLQREPYRSVISGYVKHLSWGLDVPSTGLYRLHSTLNLYFTYPPTGDTTKSEPVTVVHQLSRYSARDRQTTVVAQRSQSVSADHSDGVTSFVVTLVQLDVGDVIAISVSHSAAMNMKDRWHSQGLFLVQ